MAIAQAGHERRTGKGEEAEDDRDHADLAVIDTKGRFERRNGRGDNCCIKGCHKDTDKEYGEYATLALRVQNLTTRALHTVSIVEVRAARTRTARGFPKSPLSGIHGCW